MGMGMGLIDRERFTCIGTVTQAHGLKGDIRVYPLTSTPSSFVDLVDVLLDAGRGLEPMTVKALRQQGHHWIVSLQGVNERRDAEALVGAEILVSDESLQPLAPDEYFQHDLIGCRVETTSGRVLGDVTGVMETGANDVLEVATADGTLLVPMLAEVVVNVDIDGRRIEIDPVPGMLDDEARG